MDDRTTGESPHELLLALAGRIDDDLLAWCRELVAVGEDARALELITATLIADRTPLPAPERAAVVAATRTARLDVDADATLPAAAPEHGTPHRFAAAGSERLAAAVGSLSARQVAGCRTWVTSRLTPAGAASGPLPQPVVLVEVGAGDTRPVDVLAYQIAVACGRAGVDAAVEVVVAGVVPPPYQQAALLRALPVHGEAGPVARPADDVTAPDPPTLGRTVPPPAPRAVPAVEPVVEAPAPVTPLRGLPSIDHELPRPDPVPHDLPPRELPRRDAARPTPARTPRPGAGPGPVPIGRRNGRAPTVENEQPADVRALPVTLPSAPGSPAPASLADPMGGSPQAVRIDADDPLGIGRLPREDRAPATPDPDAWLADWITGDWAIPPESTDAAPAPVVDHPPAVDPPVPDRPVAAPPIIAPPIAAPPIPAERVEIDRVDPPPPRPGRRRAEPAAEPTGIVLRPGSVDRLSDTDRDLLVRLQSELSDPPRPRVSRRAGIAGAASTGPSGGGQPAAPPDDAR